MANPLQWIKRTIQGKGVAIFELRTEAPAKVKQPIIQQEPKPVVVIEPRKVDWGKHEDETIEELFNSGKSDSFIAEVLRRNPAEVGSRRVKLGLLKRKDENGREITVCPTRYTD